MASSNSQRELLCLAMKAVYSGMYGPRSTSRCAVLGMPSSAGTPETCTQLSILVAAHPKPGVCIQHAYQSSIHLAFVKTARTEQYKLFMSPEAMQPSRHMLQNLMVMKEVSEKCPSLCLLCHATGSDDPSQIHAVTATCEPTRQLKFLHLLTCRILSPADG